MKIKGWLAGLSREVPACLEGSRLQIHERTQWWKWRWRCPETLSATGRRTWRPLPRPCQRTMPISSLLNLVNHSPLTITAIFLKARPSSLTPLPIVPLAAPRRWWLRWWRQRTSWRASPPCCYIKMSEFPVFYVWEWWLVSDVYDLWTFTYRSNGMAFLDMGLC
jgi:hypothetical protein